MGIQKYIDILKKPDKFWFFGKSINRKEKLLALEKLIDIGTPGTMQLLFPFLINDSEEIRNATHHSIQILFEKLSGKNTYYEALKYCSFSKAKINYYQKVFSEQQFHLLMKIASLNHNGHVREQALRYLGDSDDKSAIPLLIFRLTDWVPNIRQVAEMELKKFFKPAFIPGLLENLSLFQQLQKVERVNLSEKYKEVIAFLIEQHRKKSIQYYHTLPDKERRILANELIDNITHKNELQLCLSDKDFLIRLLSLKHFDKLTAQQKSKLLNDNSARVRLNTLYLFEQNKNFKKILLDYLADKSGSIRYIARYYLKEEAIDFKIFYIKNLKDQQQIIGSLLGLLDIEAKDSTVYIEPYLKSEKVSIVKTTFHVLSTLDPETAYKFAREHLFTQKGGLRNLIIRFLSNYPRKEIVELARNKYMESKNEALKLSILKLFSQMGGYAIIPDLLMGTIDEKESIRTQSYLFVQKWKNEAINIFSRPTQEEKMKAMEVFDKVNKIHNNKRYFDFDPIEKIDFYIR